MVWVYSAEMARDFSRKEALRANIVPPDYRAANRWALSLANN
jgi:hypothetical protein